MPAYKHFLFIVLSLSLSFVTAQNKVDSLLHALAQEKEDSSKVKLYTELGDQYKRTIPDSSVYYYNKGLAIANKSNKKIEVGELLFSLSKAYLNKGESETALNYSHKALEIYKTIKDRKKEAEVLNIIGVIYRRKADYNNALKNYEKSLQIHSKTKNKRGKSDVLNNIGVVYILTGKYDKAIDFFHKTIKIAEEIGYNEKISSSYVNIANIFKDQEDYKQAIIYYKKAKVIDTKLNDAFGLAIDYASLGSVYILTEEWDKAFENNQKALTIFKKMGNKYYTSRVFESLGIIAKNKGDKKNYKKYSLKALDLLEEVGDKHGLARVSGNLANTYNESKQYNKAIVYAKKNLTLAEEIGLLKDQMLSYKYLSTAYMGQGNYKKALEYKLSETKAKDSLFNLAKTEKINEIQTKYETEKKDLELINKALEIDNLEKKAQRNKIFMLASLLVLGLGILALVLFYRNRLTQEKYKAEIFNQKLLRSQMNPHFIFNVLTSIQSYMFEKDTLKAATYLSSFSKLTRSILEGSRHDFVSLQEDFETNENYLKIQKMRYEGLFEYSINIDENIDPDHVQISPMLIQPFLENSVKHGFKDIDYKGLLEIVYKKIGDTLQITVKDNGKGVANNKEHAHKSHALSITKERLRILNKKSKKKITFTIENAIDKGYKVVFNVPLKMA